MDKGQYFPKYKRSDLVSIFAGISILAALLGLIFILTAKQLSLPFLLTMLLFVFSICIISAVGFYFGSRSGIYLYDGKIYESRVGKRQIEIQEVLSIVIIPKTKPFRSVYIGGAPKVSKTKSNGKLVYDMVLLNSTNFQISSNCVQSGDESFILNNSKKIIATCIYNDFLFNYLVDANGAIKIIHI